VPESRVLVVDDNDAELQLCVDALRAGGDLKVEGLVRSTEALTRLGGEAFDVLVTDLRMPMVDGLDLLRVAHAQDPDMPVLVLTGYPSVDTALAALKEGAADYLTKPVHPGELVAVVERLLEGRKLRREHRLLERRLRVEDTGADLIGTSPAMVELLDVVRRLAVSDLDVLIVGETGTGKELVARRMHRLSPRARGRFVPVDCGTIPEGLIESELFGHEKGAFTGADRRTMGLLEYADGGTFFLDEVQALPPTVQAKLLRTLQERTLRRVGSTEERSVVVRVVAAANESPEELVRVGRLREDLLHRLNVGRIDLPPLRERNGDVALLAEHFMRRYGGEGPAGGTRRLSGDALSALEAYAWPGNVRELQNVVAGLALIAPVRGRVSCRHVDLVLATAGAARHAPPMSLERARRACERQTVAAALARHAGRRTAAARELGLTRQGLAKIIRRLHIEDGAIEGVA
jgi:DNA-binding NtrC family response regulator